MHSQFETEARLMKELWSNRSRVNEIFLLKWKLDWRTNSFL